MTRPITLSIHPSAVAHNLALIKARAGRPVISIIKANAYGHGVQAILSAFDASAPTPDFLGLLEFERAHDLRQNLGWQGSLLMLEGAFDISDVEHALVLGLDLVVHQTQQIEWLEQLASRTVLAGKSIRVHLKLNSGMNRLGFSPEDYRAAYARLARLPNVSTIVHMTHFANADDIDLDIDARAGTSSTPPRKSPTVAAQESLFTLTIKDLPGQRSLANSAAAFYHPDIAAQWVRAGIALYGAHPLQNGQSVRALGLRPTQTLRAQVIATQTLKANDAVGYGSVFRASERRRIGVVCCGYADGYPRHARTGTPVGVMIDGVCHRVPLVGRVSMDMLTLDLSTLPQAQIGSTVELWGNHIAIDEVAQHADTIAYELMCAVMPRVARLLE